MDIEIIKRRKVIVQKIIVMTILIKSKLSAYLQMLVYIWNIAANIIYKANSIEIDIKSWGITWLKF